MLDYKNYRPEQFATDPSFRKWQLEGSEEEARFWTKWIIQNPDKQRDIERATLLLEAVEESFDQISETEIRHEIHRLASQMDQLPEIVPDRPIAPPVRWWQQRSYQIAATVLVALVSLGWWLLRSYHSVPAPLSYEGLVKETPVSLTEYVNTTSSVHLLTLSDGSTIRLQPGGRVSYPVNFADTIREVYLSGEGFFEVARNPQKPFLVYTNQLVTKVLGTSFTVKANPGEDQIQVLVRTGRVAVYPNTRRAGKENAESGTLPKEVVLKPNQKLVYLARENQFSRGLVDAPQMVIAAEARPAFSFKGAPIQEVFEELEKTYGVEIIFDEEIMKDCYLTASFADEPLFEKLDLITRTISAGYRQVDGQIVINSSGCK